MSARIAHLLRRRRRRSACCAAGIGEVPWSSAIWPILGSMFVFRLIVYLYDRSTRPRRRGSRRRSATSSCCRTSASRCFRSSTSRSSAVTTTTSERHTIYQVGVEWIWRGLLQLLVYRARLLPPDGRPGGGRQSRANCSSTCCRRSCCTCACPATSISSSACCTCSASTSRDASPLFPGVELHRLLAADQHLLEGLHDEGLLLPGLLPAAQARRHEGPGAGDGRTRSSPPGSCTSCSGSGSAARSWSSGTT